MNKRSVEKYRRQLQEMATHLGATSEALVAEAQVRIGADAGDLSSVPLHLADLGSEAESQELNATLLENEMYLRNEVRDALERIEQGKFGQCENCGKPIPAARIKALPYARYCTACAQALRETPTANLNVGRPRWEDTMAGKQPEEPAGSRSDIHAAGSAGGGTAVGGLAGSNLDAGDPFNADLEAAAGTGNFDTQVDTDDESNGYSGRSGGAVGGAPAGKRASGGKLVGR